MKEFFMNIASIYKQVGLTINTQYNKYNRCNETTIIYNQENVWKSEVTRMLFSLLLQHR